MALNPLYVIQSDLESYFVDKNTGLPLAGGQIYFYRDSERTVPKNVFELNNYPYSGNPYTALPNPLTLSSVGTVQDSGGNNVVLYWYPWITDPVTGELDLDLYYVVVTDSAGTVQFTRGAWPNTFQSSNTNEESAIFSNQISNPCFTNTFLNPGITSVFNVSGASSAVFPIGPDWSFVISGTGSVTVQQIPIAGVLNCPTSPPYVLDVEVSQGITLCNLVQTFSQNSGLWASTGNTSIFLSGSFVAQNILTGSASLTLYYIEPNGLNTAVPIVSGSFTTPYEIFQGFTANAIPESTSASTGTNGYVNVFLAFSANTHVQVTSIQVIPVQGTAGTLVQPDLTSSNRQEAFQGDYYIPRCATKQVNSFLTGWDFCVNPFQLGSAGTITTTPAYICDQTIACAGSTGNISFGRDPVTNGLQFSTTSGSNDSFYTLQYLQGSQVKNMINDSLSTNAYVNSSSNNFVMQTYLFRGSQASGVIPTLPTTIGTVSSNGTFTLTAANWTQIPRIGLLTPTVSLGVYNGNIDYGFSGWRITSSAQINDTDKFAVVNTFTYTTSSTAMTLNSFSVVPGDLPCRPASKTVAETLTQCQYYYEQTYNIGVPAGTATSSGVIIAEQTQSALSTGGGNYTVTIYPLYVPVPYKTLKRATVTPTFYSIAGTSGDVTALSYYGPSSTISASVPVSNWSAVNIGLNGCALAPINRVNGLTSGGGIPIAGTPIVYAFESIVEGHFVADARLGVV